MALRAVVIAALLSSVLTAPIPWARTDRVARLSHSVRTLNPNLSVRDVAAIDAVAASDAVEATDSIETNYSLDTTDATEHGPGDDDEKRKKSGGKPKPSTAKPNKPNKPKKPKNPKQSSNKPKSSGSKPKSPKPNGLGKWYFFPLRNSKVYGILHRFPRLRLAQGYRGRSWYARSHRHTSPGIR